MLERYSACVSAMYRAGQPAGAGGTQQAPAAGGTHPWHPSQQQPASRAVLRR
jgi:hypothetical protein